MWEEDKRKIELEGAIFLEFHHVQEESQGSPSNEKEEEGRKTIEVGNIFGMPLEIMRLK